MVTVECVLAGRTRTVAAERVDMPIAEPVTGFHGERDESSGAGGVCPLCGQPYDGHLPSHLPCDG